MQPGATCEVALRSPRLKPGARTAKASFGGWHGTRSKAGLPASGQGDVEAQANGQRCDRWLPAIRSATARLEMSGRYRPSASAGGFVRCLAPGFSRGLHFGDQGSVWLPLAEERIWARLHPIQ